jgi:four helix bundle protein
MEKIKRLEDFEIYKIAMEIGEEVWNIVSIWDNFSKDTLGKQLVRSADSIAANIAEGYGRFSFKDRRAFTLYSRGSLLETKTWITKSNNRKLTTKEQFDRILEKLILKGFWFADFGFRNHLIMKHLTSCF